MEYRSAKFVYAAPNTTYATGRNVTLTGGATELVITTRSQPVYARLGGTATLTASLGWYIPKDTVYHMYPAPGDTSLCLLGITATAYTYVQQLY